MRPSPLRTVLAASDHPAETPDPVNAKAKITVATSLEESASAEFDEMKRAMRNKYVDDEAYVVDGPRTVAATAYQSICNSLEQPNAADP